MRGHRSRGAEQSRQGEQTEAPVLTDGWVLLVYRVPSEPASKRVSVWRDLKRLGGLYLQQCVCILPNLPELAEEVERVAEKITSLAGESTLFSVPRLRPEDERKIVDAFRGLRDKEYLEIIEECETKFVREVEFEHFRENYSFGEAEEIGQDLEKIRRWFGRVVERDWFGGGRRREVEEWIARCEELLSEFEHEVYLRNSDDALGGLPVPLGPVADRRISGAWGRESADPEPDAAATDETKETGS